MEDDEQRERTRLVYGRDAVLVSATCRISIAAEGTKTKISTVAISRQAPIHRATLVCGVASIPIPVKYMEAIQLIISWPARCASVISPPLASGSVLYSVKDPAKKAKLTIAAANIPIAIIAHKSICSKARREKRGNFQATTTPINPIHPIVSNRLI